MKGKVIVVVKVKVKVIVKVSKSKMMVYGAKHFSIDIFGHAERNVSLDVKGVCYCKMKVYCHHKNLHLFFIIQVIFCNPAFIFR